jgi:hypothetical protein
MSSDPKNKRRARDSFICGIGGSVPEKEKRFEGLTI